MFPPTYVCALRPNPTPKPTPHTTPALPSATPVTAATPHAALERSRFGGTSPWPARSDEDDAPFSRSDLSKGKTELMEQGAVRINWSVLAVSSAVIVTFSTMAMGYFTSRCDMPLSIRAALHPLFGKRVRGPWATASACWRRSAPSLV